MFLLRGPRTAHMCVCVSHTKRKHRESGLGRGSGARRLVAGWVGVRLKRLVHGIFVKTVRVRPLAVTDRREIRPRQINSEIILELTCKRAAVGSTAHVRLRLSRVVTIEQGGCPGPLAITANARNHRFV